MTQTEEQNVPALRFPEFGGEWIEAKLGEVAPKPSYGMNASAVPFDGTHKYIRITDIDEDTRVFSPNPLTSPQKPISKEYQLQSGDIVFTRTGASTGKTYLYSPKDGDLFFAGFLIRFRVKEGNPAFIYAQTLRSEYRKWVTVMSMRSGQPGINAHEYSQLKFNAPTLPEQQKIAAFLSSVDRKIEQLGQKKALLQRYKKGMMQKLFSQELRFKDAQGHDFPDWEEKRLGEVAERCTLKNSDVKHTRVLTNSAVRGVIDQGDYFDHAVANAENLGGYYIVEMGDFVYNPRISMSAPVGPIKRNDLGAGVMSPLYSVFRFNSENTEFYEQYYSSSFWHRYMKSVANYGARHDRMAISTKDFMNMPLPNPCPEEQQKIADFLSSIDRKIDLVSSELDHAKAFKKGLLQQMFI